MPGGSAVSTPVMPSWPSGRWTVKVNGLYAPAWLLTLPPCTAGLKGSGPLDWQVLPLGPPSGVNEDVRVASCPDHVTKRALAS